MILRYIYFDQQDIISVIDIDRSGNIHAFAVHLETVLVYVFLVIFVKKFSSELRAKPLKMTMSI